MGMRIQKKRLSDFRAEDSLRNDFKYITSFEANNFEYYSYKSLFYFVPYAKVNIHDLEQFYYAEISNINKLGEIDPVLLSFEDRSDESEGLFKKIEKGDIINPSTGDILISKIRPYLNKNVLVTKNDLYFTKAFIHIRPKINSELFYIVLRCFFIDQLNAISRQGKGYPTLKEDDIKSIRFSKAVVDVITKYESEILKKIHPLKEEISKLKDSKQKPLDIINQVIGDELDFDWEAFELVKMEKNYSSNLKKFASNIDCRMGVRFHNKAGKYLHTFLYKKTNKKIKNFIAEPITLGKSISPSDYNEDGEFYYIAMSNIKTWALDYEDCKKVSEDYAFCNMNKTVKKGDILLARSGEGTIGKVALINEEDISAIFADFTQRIRLINYNPLCAYYYFRSDFFQYLVYTHKKGLGNNTNIFPSQIQEFPIPDWDEKQQQRIIEQIKRQLDRQELIDRQIKEKGQKINKIIEELIQLEKNTKI